MTTPPPWHALMRHEVRRHARGSGRARELPVHCWVGHPAREVVRLAPARSLEVRAAVVERALDSLGETTGALSWVTRSGDLDRVGDDDLGWWAAARSGFRTHGVDLEGFCVLNRRGWVDLASGAGRTWVRLRT